MGAFSHSANYYVVYPRNTPESHPTTEACMIHSKQHRGCRIQDPGTRGKHQTKTKNPWCTSRGCRVQNSGPWDPWLPVVTNSRFFAQRWHSARCAPYVCTYASVCEIAHVSTQLCINISTQTLAPASHSGHPGEPSLHRAVRRF